MDYRGLLHFSLNYRAVYLNKTLNSFGNNCYNKNGTLFFIEVNMKNEQILPGIYNKEEILLRLSCDSACCYLLNL